MPDFKIINSEGKLQGSSPPYKPDSPGPAFVKATARQASGSTSGIKPEKDEGDSEKRAEVDRR